MIRFLLQNQNGRSYLFWTALCEKTNYPNGIGDGLRQNSAAPFGKGEWPIRLASPLRTFQFFPVHLLK